MPRAAEPSGSGRTHSFPSELRVKKGSEIRDILKTGKSNSLRGMRIAWRDNGLGHLRMGIALKRGFGRAVDRNRAKRLVRESFRLLRPALDSPCDMIFQVFPGTDSYAERSSQVERLLQNAGLLPRSRP
jgi:ribonuclease P protein component